MHNKYTLSLSLAITLAGFLAGCSQKQSEPRREDTGSPAPMTAHGSNPSTANPHGSSGPAAAGPELKFTPPEGWVSENPTSSMRKAQYKLPHIQGDPEDAEMVVFYFQGGGGGVQANIDRWIAQFTKQDGTPASDLAKVGHKQSHGIPITTVDVSGTYLSSSGPMMSDTATKQNYRMLAAVAETSGGPWFFKLTGPAKTVAKWEPSYQAFLETIR